MKSDGSIDRFKARLVGKGYNQKEGIDFDETFSPVVQHATVGIILVNNAVLHGFVKEIVHMDQPPGFTNPSYPNYLCKLHKAIYGHKQAPRAWFDSFSLFLLHVGFFCSKVDSSLFILHCSARTILLPLYVDDIIVINNNF